MESRRADEPFLRIALAGQVEVTREGVPVDSAGLGGLGRVALAYLVTERRRPVPRGELAEALWGEDLPRTWETSLRVVISKVRSLLESAGLDRAEAVVSGFGTYKVNLPAGAVVDIEEAEEHLVAGRAALAAGDAAGAIGAASAAAGVTGAEFVTGGAGRWIERRQEALRDLRLSALELLAEAHLANQAPTQAVIAAEGAAGMAPLRESAHVLLMRAHAAGGNRAEALRAYDRMRRLLVDELGVSPSPQTESLYLALLRDEAVEGPATAPAAGAAPAAPRVNLPAALSSFVGRGDEVAEVTARVRSGRLVTLVGTGGLGKTRLALEAAHALAAEFAGGAALVALGEVADGGGVGPQALAALGLAEEPGRPVVDTIASALADHAFLLVVDNCEHLLQAAADLVSELLARCPDLVVMATSREALRVPGETVWPVPALDPAEAVRLFRARSGAGAEGADDDEVGALCRRLDSIPLAIELAAARTDVLSVPEILARLDDRFRLLTGGARTAPARQQTLRGAVDWTYDALPEAEQALFQRVAAFAGAFTLDSVAFMATSPPQDALDRLTTLVARSLVLVQPGQPSRYRLLETLRAYAAEKLEDSGQRPATEARLLAWAADLAEAAAFHLDGPQQAVWLERLDADHANLRGALAVGLGGEDALRLATALGRFWEIRGHLAEGREWLRAALAEADPLAPPLLRARAHNAAANLAQRQGDYAAARSRLEESLAIRRRHDDALGAAIALHGLGNLAALQHDLVAARQLYDQALAVGREVGDTGLVAAALDNLGWVAHVSADFPSARAYYEEALTLRRAAGDRHGAALVLGHLGDLAYQQGDYARAAALHEESLDVRTALGDRAGRADALATLGHLAMHEGDLDAARGRLGESLTIRRDLGDRAGLPAALISLGDLALLAGELDAADALVAEAVEAATANRDPGALAHALVHHGRVARVQGRVDEAARRYAGARAAAGALAPDAVTAEWIEGVATTADPVVGARLFGAADALREAIGAAVPPHERPAHEQDVAAVRAALGASAFTKAWKQGRAMTLDEALAAASAQ